MKKIVLFLAALVILAAGLWTTKAFAEYAARRSAETQTVNIPEPLPEPTAAEQTIPETTLPEEVTAETVLPEEVTAETATEPVSQTEPATMPSFTEEEEMLLLKLAMSERGDLECPVCMALVMRTVLNRVESPKFSSTIKGVIYAQDQFTPAMDGTLETANPDWFCYKAMEMIKKGWDDSQGALYYEWSQGESWHSRNLNLLTQHCDTRFYN